MEAIGVGNQANDNLMENGQSFPIQRVGINQEFKEAEEELSLRESCLGMDSSNFPNDRKFDVDMRNNIYQAHHKLADHTDLKRQPRKLLKMSDERNSYETVGYPCDIQTEREVNRALPRNVQPLSFHSLGSVKSSIPHIKDRTATRNFPHFGSYNADVKGNNLNDLMSENSCARKGDEDLRTMHHNFSQKSEGHLQNCYYGTIKDSFCSYDPKRCHVQKVENKSPNNSVNDIDLVGSNSNDLENIPLLIPASNLSENSRLSEPILSNTNYQKAGDLTNVYNSEFSTFLRENISEEDYFDEMVREAHLCSQRSNERNSEDVIHMEENFNQVHQNQDKIKNFPHKNVDKKSNFLLNDKAPLTSSKRANQNGSEIALEERHFRQVNIPEGAVWQDSTSSSHPDYSCSVAESYYHEKVDHFRIKNGGDFPLEHVDYNFPLADQEQMSNSQHLNEIERDDGYFCANSNRTGITSEKENPVSSRVGVYQSTTMESDVEVLLEEGSNSLQHYLPMEEDNVAENDIINDFQMEATSSGNKCEIHSWRNERIFPINIEKSLYCSENIADSCIYNDEGKLSQEMEHPDEELVSLQSNILPHKTRLREYEETTENKKPVFDSSNALKYVAHVVDRSSNKTQKCSTCLKSFLSSEVLLQHLMQHIKDETVGKIRDINVPKREFCTSKKKFVDEEEIEILWDSAISSENSNTNKCAEVRMKLDTERNLLYGDHEVIHCQESSKNGKRTYDAISNDDFSANYCNTLRKENESSITPLQLGTGKGSSKNISTFHANTGVLNFVTETRTENLAKNTCLTFERIVPSSTMNRGNNPGSEMKVDRPDYKFTNFSLENQKISKKSDYLLKMKGNSTHSSMDDIELRSLKVFMPSNEATENNLDVNPDRNTLIDLDECKTPGIVNKQSFDKNRYSFDDNSSKQSQIAAANEPNSNQTQNMKNLLENDIVKEVTCIVREQKSSTSDDLVSEKIYNSATAKGNVPCRDLEKLLEENTSKNSKLSLLMDICDVSSTNENFSSSNKCTEPSTILNATPEISFKNGVCGDKTVSNNLWNADSSKMVSEDLKSCIKTPYLDRGTSVGRNIKLSEVKSKVESPLCVSKKNINSPYSINDGERTDSVFETKDCERTLKKNNDNRARQIGGMVGSRERKRWKISPRFDDDATANLSFPCSMCLETFATDSSLLKHGFKHHRGKTDYQPVGKKKMRLSKTKKYFANSKKIKTNKLEVNPLLPEFEQTSFPCSRCPETFACKSSLLRHGVERHRGKSDGQSGKSKDDSDSSIKSYVEYLRKNEHVIKEKYTNKNSGVLRKGKNSKRKSLTKCLNSSKNNVTDTSNGKHSNKPVSRLSNEAVLHKNDSNPNTGSTGKSKGLTLTSDDEIQIFDICRGKIHTSMGNCILAESKHASLINHTNTTKEKHITNEAISYLKLKNSPSGSLHGKSVCASSEPKETLSSQQKNLTNNSQLPQNSDINEESSQSHYTELDSSESLLNKLSVLMSEEMYGSWEVFHNGLMDETKINECCKKIQNILAVYDSCESITFRCPMCLKKFSTWCLITTHIVTKHQESSKDWPLSLLFLRDVFKKVNEFPVCGSIADFQQTCESHELHTCDMCKNSFSTNIALLKHKIWAHNIPRKVGI